MELQETKILDEYKENLGVFYVNYVAAAFYDNTKLLGFRSLIRPFCLAI